MKKLIKVLVIAAIVITIGFYIVDCSNPSSPGGSGPNNLGEGIKSVASGVVFVLDTQSPAMSARSSGGIEAGDTFSLRMARANANGTTGNVDTVIGTVLSRNGNILTLKPNTGANITITLDDQGNMIKMDGAQSFAQQPVLLPFADNNLTYLDGVWIRYEPNICHDNTGHEWQNCNGKLDPNINYCVDSGAPYLETLIFGHGRMFISSIATEEQGGHGFWTQCVYEKTGKGWKDQIQRGNVIINSGNFTLSNNYLWSWCAYGPDGGLNFAEGNYNPNHPACTPQWRLFNEGGFSGTYSLSNNGNTMVVNFLGDSQTWTRVQTH